MKHDAKRSKRQGIYVLFLSLFLSSCMEEKLSSDDVEYRRNDFGTEILYAIGEDEPFGQGKRAYIIDKYDNGKPRYKIAFLNGLKDGKVEFWQENGLPELAGFYSKGKRDGTFTAFGKTGELIYKKNFKDDNLSGEFTLYYPASNSDYARFLEKLHEVRASKPIYSWDRIKKVFSNSEIIDPEEIKVKNHVRLEASFSGDFPVGKYRAYFHPGKHNLSLEELVKEEGYFTEPDMNESDYEMKIGHLGQRQKFYYPRAAGLVVILPDKIRLETIHPTTKDGFSRAIDEATKSIQEIPAYRNKDKEPAFVYTIDDRGNEIVPIWSTHVKKFAVRNLDGKLLPQQFPKKDKPLTLETYLDEVIPYAEKLMVEIGLSENPNIKIYIESGASVDIVGLNDKGDIIDIFWSSPKKEKVDNLENRIFAKRLKISRSWESGFSNESQWLLNNGSKFLLRGKNNTSSNWKSSPY